jgi:hypothetical protein
MFSMLKMKYPLYILPIPRIEIRAYQEARVQYLDVKDTIDFQVPETRLTARAGEAKSLPANQYQSVCRSAAKPVGMNDARKRLSPQGDPAGVPIFSSIPQQFRNGFYLHPLAN